MPAPAGPVENAPKSTPETAPAPTGYGPVFAVPEFRAVFAAHAFSLLGLVVSEIALSVLVYWP